MDVYLEFSSPAFERVRFGFGSIYAIDPNGRFWLSRINGILLPQIKCISAIARNNLWFRSICIRINIWIAKWSMCLIPSFRPFQFKANQRPNTQTTKHVNSQSPYWSRGRDANVISIISNQYHYKLITWNVNYIWMALNVIITFEFGIWFLEIGCWSATPTDWSISSAKCIKMND